MQKSGHLQIRILFLLFLSVFLSFSFSCCCDEGYYHHYPAGVRSGQEPRLTPDVRRDALCLPLLGLLHTAFITLKYVSFSPSFVQGFYPDLMLNSIKCFFCIHLSEHVMSAL